MAHSHELVPPILGVGVAARGVARLMARTPVEV